MENGGDNEHRPWMFDSPATENDTASALNIYRTFVNIHYSLVSFFWSEGTQAFASGNSILHAPSNDDEYSFTLGQNQDIFVAPMVDDANWRSILFPAGEQWVDWWQPGVLYSGGDKVNYSCPLTHFPVFKRVGSILPFNEGQPVAEGGPGRGLRLEFPGVFGENVHRILNIHDDKGGIQIVALQEQNTLKISVSATTRPIRLHFSHSSLTGRVLESGDTTTHLTTVSTTFSGGAFITATPSSLDCRKGCVETLGFA
mmetsp:Transcript_9418/g.25541  ORF Transcript_9418/g.25541 Transcript_9418/m.25541 type:complete len:256 (+) Transcript_9418:1143-1910(+)